MINPYKRSFWQWISVRLAKISYFQKKIACFVNQDGHQAAIFLLDPKTCGELSLFEYSPTEKLLALEEADILYCLQLRMPLLVTSNFLGTTTHICCSWFSFFMWIYWILLILWTETWTTLRFGNKNDQIRYLCIISILISFGMYQ